MLTSVVALMEVRRAVSSDFSMERSILAVKLAVELVVERRV